MAINFPDSPTTGQSFTTAGRTWIYDGTTWNNDATAEFSSVQLDTTAGVTAGVGEFAWNASQETLDLGLDANVTLQVGQEHVVRVKNASASVAIPNRTVVMFAGATGDTVTVSPMVADGTVSSEYLVGITTEEIPADGFGFVTQFGYVNNVNTLAWPLGTILYADPATPGGLTSTAPQAPNLKLEIAAVTRSHATTGRILVRVHTGESLSGLHDVQVSSPATGQVVQYDGSKWVNSGIAISEVSGLQTQLDSKMSTAGGVFSGDIYIQKQFPGLELKSTGGGFPYIDFADTTADDFDVRMSMPAAARRIVLEPSIDNGERSLRNIYTSTSTPSGGSDGDIWFQYTP